MVVDNSQCNNLWSGNLRVHLVISILVLAFKGVSFWNHSKFYLISSGALACGKQSGDFTSLLYSKGITQIVNACEI